MPPYIKALAVLLAGGLLVSLGCASTRPIPASRQADYFQCSGVTIPQSEASLGGAGYLIQAKGDTYVQTDWYAPDLGGQATTAWVLAGVHSFKIRVAVAKTAEGVRFTLFQQAQQQSGYAQRNLENQWSTITQGQTDDATTRAMLNKVRQDVCGGPPFFR